MQNHVNYNE